MPRLIFAYLQQHGTVQGGSRGVGGVDRRGPCLLNPHSVGLVLLVSSAFAPGGCRSQSQRSLSFVQLCVWALTRGTATGAMLMGTKWGVESPVDYGRRRDACVSMYSRGVLGPFALLLSFLPPQPPSSQTNRRSRDVGRLHALLISTPSDLAVDLSVSKCTSVRIKPVLTHGVFALVRSEVKSVLYLSLG